MTTTTPDPEAVVRELLDLYGGAEAAWRKFDQDFAQLVAAWEQDTTTIGRILRAHLFVEYFLTEYLAARNPELGSFEEARLSFAQKVALVGTSAGDVSYLLPGIRRLNTIRNRLAHGLHADVSAEDAEVFLGVDLFRAMRNARHAPQCPSKNPVDVLDEFAQHAGMALHASANPDRALWAEAFRRAERKAMRSDENAT